MASTYVSKLIETLSDKERFQIIADHKQFERDGFIGDCMLRSTAARVADNFGGFAGSAPIWMEAVANACYRYYAELFIQSEDFRR